MKPILAAILIASAAPAMAADGYYQRQTWADRALGRALPARALDADEPTHRPRPRAYRPEPATPRVLGYRAPIRPPYGTNCLDPRPMPAGTVCAVND